MDQAFLTNFSNSKATVIESIAAAERIHWIEALKQAELTMHAKEDAIVTNQAAIEREIRQIEIAAEKIRLWAKARSLFKKIRLLDLIIADKIATLESRIASFALNQKYLETLFRDAKMEWSAAKEQYDRLLEEHPEALKLDYQELQDAHSRNAMLERRAKTLAAIAWSAQRGLSESFGHILVNASEKDRLHLLQRELQIREGVAIDEKILQLACHIAELPEDTKQEVVKFVQESQLGDVRANNSKQNFVLPARIADQ